MAKTKAERDRQRNRNNKKRKLGHKSKKKNQSPIKHNEPILSGDNSGAAAGSDDDGSPLNSDRIQHLLEPYTKDQLTGFLLDAAAADPALLARIRTVADNDVSHRKVFVHGLGWDTTRETLIEAFRNYGEIEECNVIVDKATGRSKGYGFVLFRARAGAAKALKQPQKTIKNRLTHSQLASVGPVPAAGAGPHPNAEGRRVYVSNVHADAAPDKLKAFFAKFGEIEVGPIGFDMNTGKSRGFALFIYKTKEGAARALQEPYKMFEGHQLHCQKATEKGKGVDVAAAAMAPAALLGATQQPVLAAVAAAQNLALLGQNPAYAALLGQNPLLAAAALNPLAAATLNPALNQVPGLLAPQGQAYGGAGIGSGASSVLGAYGSQGSYASQGAYGSQGSYASQGAYGSQGATGLYGLQSYSGSQLGQSSYSKLGSSFMGFPSYM